MNDQSGANIGVISIPPVPVEPSTVPFSSFYTTLGSNTGNLMFTVAVHKQLEGAVQRVPFRVDPEKVNKELDFIVIPCANWLNPSVDWDWFCDLLERVEIPLVPVGLGVQSPHSDIDRVKIGPSSERLAHLFSKKSKYISVRGDFTRDYLNSIGVKNVVTTGCPSLYTRVSAETSYNPSGEISILSTRYPVRPGFIDPANLNQQLFSFAAKHDLDIIFQSEREEMEFLFYGNTDALFPQQFPDGLQQLYGIETPEDLTAYIESRGKCFTSLETWAAYVQTKAAVVGTRLHGTILSLNAGCPAILYPHDSRTAEMITFASLPTGEIPTNFGDLSPKDIKALIRDDDFYRYIERRSKNSHTYRNFLTESGLTYDESVML